MKIERVSTNKQIMFNIISAVTVVGINTLINFFTAVYRKMSWCRSKWIYCLGFEYKCKL